MQTANQAGRGRGRGASAGAGGGMLEADSLSRLYCHAFNISRTERRISMEKSAPNLLT